MVTKQKRLFRGLFISKFSFRIKTEMLCLKLSIGSVNSRIRNGRFIRKLRVVRYQFPTFSKRSYAIDIRLKRTCLGLDHPSVHSC